MQPTKLCPRCQQQAALEALYCLRCGHQYRTQFSAQQTQLNMPTPQAYPMAPTRKRPWIWAVPLVTVAFAVLCFFMFRPGPVLAGKWESEFAYYNVHSIETFVFRPDGSAEHAKQWTEAGRTETVEVYSCKWYLQNEGYTKDGTLAGILMLRSIDDSIEAVPKQFLLSSDGKHLRFIEKNGNTQEFYRK